MIGRAPLEVRLVSEICVALAVILFVTALLGVAMVAVGFGFSGAVLAALGALGVVVFGAGSVFTRRRSRSWWLVLNSFFVLGAAVGAFQAFQGRPLAILGSMVCAACLVLLTAPARSRAFFDQPL
jgi:hypothetical protein